ncbi:hypothetical protein [Thermaerobacter marianensis]|uniref:hypothetical protein n=1 Tax=Thermaerobacter marianensis TaxID=73919 RepID=UPI000309ED0D|nr:hypothetical protein [Thermaerobacter marianensis]
MPRALAWAALAAGLALAGLALQRQAPAVAATAQAVAATAELLRAWHEGSPAAAGAWVAPAAAAPGGAWLAGLARDLPDRVPPGRVPPSPPAAGGRAAAGPAGETPAGAAPAPAPGTVGPWSPWSGAAGPPPPADPAPGTVDPAAAAADPAALLAAPLTSYAIGSVRPDAAGRLHVTAVTEVAIPGAGYAGRFVRELVWRPGPGAPRLVAASSRQVLEVAVRGDALAWRRSAGPWQQGVGLADLPLRAQPPGGPPGVDVDVSRDGFGPIALAGPRGVLLTTRGARPLVALWSWRPNGASAPAGSSAGPAARPATGTGSTGGPPTASRIVVLDVLYRAQALGWRVDPDGRYAVLTVQAEDGSRVAVTYDLDRGGPVSTRPAAGGGRTT